MSTKLAPVAAARAGHSARNEIVDDPRSRGEGSVGWTAYLPIIALVAIWIVATLPRIGLGPASNDEAVFLKVGRAIATTGLPIQSPGAEPTFFLIHTPLYVYLVAAVSLLPLDLLTAMRGISWLTGLGTLFLVASMVRGWQGLVGAGLIATSSLFLALSWWAYQEIPMAFAMTASVYLMRAGRIGWAGVAAAAAVMLKEFALLFVAVFAIYVFARHGLRLAWRFAWPTVVAFLGWLLYAWSLSPRQFDLAMARWLGAATTETEGRFAGPPLEWLILLAGQVGPLVLGFAVIGLGYAAWRRRPDPLALTCAAYAVAALAASTVLSMKTPRWWMGIIPFAAIAGGLLLAVRDDRHAAIAATAAGDVRGLGPTPAAAAARPAARPTVARGAVAAATTPAAHRGER